MLGLGEFLPSNIFMDWMASFFCHEGNLQVHCIKYIFSQSTECERVTVTPILGLETDAEKNGMVLDFESYY